MIDQTAVATGMPVAPKNTSRKDHADAFAQNGEEAKSFKDLVDDGGLSVDEQVLSGELTDQIAGSAKPEEGLNAKVALPENRVKVITNLESLSRFGRNGSPPESIPGKDVASERHEADKTGSKADPNVKDSTLATAADELRALLGLADQDEDVKPTPTADEKVAQPKKSGKPDAARDDGASQKAEDQTGLPHSASSMTPEKAHVTELGANPPRAAIPDHAAEKEAGRPLSQGTAAIVGEKLSDEKDAAPVASDLAMARKKTLSDIDQPTSKTEFVTVLESRRYLGFGPDSNAGTLTNAIRHDSSLSNALSIAHLSADRNMTGTEVNTLKLQLNPENLGSMTASLRLKGDELSVEVKVETVEAYRQLSSDRDGIVRALQDQGFNIDQVSIQLSPSAKNDNGQDGGQSSNGQNLREGQSDSNRQREDNARRMSNPNAWSENDQNNTQNPVGSQSGGIGSGNLYL